MNKSLLVTRPNYDSATHYLYHWTEPVINEAKKKQIPVYDLKGSKAKKSIFLSFLKSKYPGLIFLNGHGNATCVAGHNDEVILDKTLDTGMLSNSILYARSCDSGKVLGNTLVQRGVLAFIGYIRKFIVGTTRSKAAMMKNFGKMISSAGSFEERFAARWLWSNIRSQVLIGDKNASFV